MNRQGAEAAEGRLKYLACMADLAVKYGAGETEERTAKTPRPPRGRLKLLACVAVKYGVDSNATGQGGKPVIDFAQDE